MGEGGLEHEYDSENYANCDFTGYGSMDFA